MSFETSYIRAQSFDRAASLRGTLLPAPAGVGIGGEALPENGISGFLVWLRLWLGCVAEGILTDVFPHFRDPNPQSGYPRGYPRGYQRPPSLLPDSERAAIAPQVLCGRRRRRIIARGIPASRRYDGLQYLNDRQLTGNQFLERACRLSVNGRVGIYGLEYRLRLCQRKHQVCACFADVSALAPSGSGVSVGVSKFHLGPD